MIDLIANNLGGRQHEFNGKVQEAFDSKVDFDEIKLKEELSDIDRLFKIELASLYRNIDYIGDTLKSGDNLYISRALKCTWLYDDEYKYFINPDNLHNNVFSFMSIRMKKKTLVAIATNIKNAERAYDFYSYCKNMQLNDISSKYLIKTSNSVKHEFIQKHVFVPTVIKWEHFFGYSIDLITFYIEMSKLATQTVDQDLFYFRYLFLRLPDSYLNLLETYTNPPPNFKYHYFNRFGLRMSKEIMIKHKHRVLLKPWLYLRKVNLKIIVKYSTSEDAKKIIIDMMPDNVITFWRTNFYLKYIDFFNLLPGHEKYPFLKKIFNEKYPEAIFEMSSNFFSLKYYEMFTPERRNAWALQHLELKWDLLGPGKDFLLYKFINFEKAFVDIKKMIFITSCHNKRSEMLEVLIDSASNLTHLEKLISYYYKRHVNESSNNKTKFIDKIIKQHDVFQFPETCWAPFHKLLNSFDFNNTGHFSDKYTMLIIVYNIIHNNIIPHSLESSCVFKQRSYLFTTYLQKLKLEQQELIYQTIMNYNVGKILELSEKACTHDENEQRVRSIIEYIHSVLTFLQGFNKTKEDCPQIVLNFVKLHQDEFKHYEWFKSKKEFLKEATLMSLLKKDKMLLVNKLPEIKNSLHHYKVLNLKKLWQKIKIYFFNDIRKSVLIFFEEWLAEKDAIKSCKNYNHIIFALFQLGDEYYNINFCRKYVPTEPKIQHDIIDKNLLQIQKAICRFAYYSRPSLPLEIVLQYIKGDYVPFCLSMLNSFLVNLPLQQSLKFIQAILDAPVSTQKHGLRLAFVSYSMENLICLINDFWKKTKNVSLRAIIYKSLFEKVKSKKTNVAVKAKLYEVLRLLTLDLNEDDQDEIFDLMVSGSLPSNFNGSYLQTSWTAVQKLSDYNPKNVNRKIKVIRKMASYMVQIGRDFCRTEIIDQHVKKQLSLENVLDFNNSSGNFALVNEKWNFTAKYITHFDSEDDQKYCSNLLEFIMKNCAKMWHEISNEKFLVRAYLHSFINRLLGDTDYRKDSTDKSYIVPIYEQIVEFFIHTLPLKETYHIILKLNIVVLGRTSVGIGEFNTEKQAITYDNLSVTEVSDRFCNGIIQLINNLLKKQQFYYSFYSDTADIIAETIPVMTSWTNLNNDNLKINVCLGLIKFNTKEVYMLVSNLLPIDVDKKHKDSQTSIIRILNEYADEEVKTFTYHKFILPNFTSRF